MEEQLCRADPLIAPTVTARNVPSHPHAHAYGHDFKHHLPSSPLSSCDTQQPSPIAAAKKQNNKKQKSNNSSRAAAAAFRTAHHTLAQPPKPKTRTRGDPAPEPWRPVPDRASVQTNRTRASLLWHCEAEGREPKGPPTQWRLRTLTDQQRSSAHRSCRRLTAQAATTFTTPLGQGRTSALVATMHSLVLSELPSAHAPATPSPRQLARSRST